MKLIRTSKNLNVIAWLCSSLFLCYINPIPAQAQDDYGQYNYESKPKKQAYLLRNGQKFLATQNWDFSVENYSWQGGLEAQVARKSGGGMILVTAATAFSSSFIGGNLSIFLADGSTITCLDRKIRDRSNSKSKCLYYLTEGEMQLLASEPITQIRFSILESASVMGPRKEAYVAKNSSTYSYNDELSYKTNEDVAAIMAD